MQEVDNKKSKYFMLKIRISIILIFTFFVLFYIGTCSNYLIKSIIKYICLCLAILSFGYLIFTIIKDRKDRSKQTKIDIFLNAIVVFYCVCCIVFLYLLYGNNTKFREWLVTKAMGSMSHHYLCKIFYDDEYIREILNSNYIEDTNEETDTSMVIIPKTDGIEYNPNWNEYEKQMFEGHTSDEIYRMLKFKVRGQNAFLAVVYNPKNLSVMCSENVLKKGEFVVSMAKRTNALIAINGGRFYDPNHWSNGGIPRGVTIMNGKIISNYEYSSPLGVIGITNDDVLVLYKNKNAKELVNLGVRDAVTSKPFLIVNGKNMYTKGNGGYGYEARTAIGQREDGVMLLLVVESNDSRTNGASMLELTEVFNNYGAINAAALDGGTSSVMVENGVLISDPINDPFVHETRKIATAFIVTKPNLISDKNAKELENSKIWDVLSMFKDIYSN